MNRNPVLNKIVAFFTFALLVSMILLISTLGRCATTSVKNRVNSLGVEQSYQNQMVYMVGSPRAVNLFEEKNRYFTNVTFRPFGSTLIYTESILFCGNDVESFGDSRMRIVAYRRAAERMYQGVACHSIYRVIELDMQEGN